MNEISGYLPLIVYLDLTAMRLFGPPILKFLGQMLLQVGEVLEIIPPTTPADEIGLQIFIRFVRVPSWVIGRQRKIIQIYEERRVEALVVVSYGYPIRKALSR